MNLLESLTNITILDVVDVLIVAYLVYLVYKLLRGTIAINVFIGVILFYLFYLVVSYLDMKLLTAVMGKFVGFGVLFLVIIFQPEVRRFFLLIGNTLKGRLEFMENWLNLKGTKIATFRNERAADDIVKSISELSKTKTGALIVITDDFGWKNYSNTGVEINADVNDQLLESIFFKNSPLHDGAVIIAGDKIVAASCVVAVSQKQSLPGDLGLRHRAAVGVTESSNAMAIIVSEETGNISMAKGGKLFQNAAKSDIKSDLLNRLH